MSLVRPHVGLIDEAAARLSAVTTAPRREAGQLLAHAVGVARRSDLHLISRSGGGGAPLDPEARARFEALVARRASGVPLQYVLGYAEFYESRLLVRPGVFIPRPETELLVDAVLRTVPAGGRVLDLGTGTGAIVLSVLRERPDVCANAVDVSGEAVTLARENAAAMGLTGRLTLHEGDLFAPLPEGSVYDVVVSNPPYVATGDALPPDVRDHEPPAALFGGADGLEVVRRIVEGSPARLRPGGWLALEIGETQGAAVRKLLETRGLTGLQLERDLAGKERVVTARFSADGR